MQKPRQKKQLTDEWWNSVIGIKTDMDAASKKTEGPSIVVSGPTNIRLFLSKEPETNTCKYIYGLAIYISNLRLNNR